MGNVTPIGKPRPRRCDMCNGSGEVSDGTDERGRPRTKTCPQCGGNREVE